MQPIFESLWEIKEGVVCLALAALLYVAFVVDVIRYGFKDPK